MRARERRPFKEDRQARKLARHLKASRRAEARYTLDLVRIMGSVHRGVLKVVEREHLAPLRSVEKGEVSRQDAPLGLGDKLLRRMMVFVRPQVQGAFDLMAGEVDKRNGKGLALLGVDPRHVAGIESVIEHAREANMRLITGASSDFLDEVRGVLEENEGAHPEHIAALLQERVGVSKSRAQLIARDQTLKLNAQIAEHRQRAAGVSEYRWSGALDERERPMHRALEGQKFSWDDPPETSDNGDRNHPGEDFQCRCVALPVIDELEPDEPEPPVQGELPPFEPSPEV
jgi:SPP1 gp7 family putative phage head morphogenesis protein